jgi:hypothetical protein
LFGAPDSTRSPVCRSREYFLDIGRAYAGEQRSTIPAVSRLARPAVVAVLFAALGCLPAAGTARPAATRVLTEHGVDGLRLGRTRMAIRTRGLIGRIHQGCELASPRPTVASLRPPLVGAATFGGSGPGSRLTALSIRAGAVTDHGIAIGSSTGQVLRAYPNARVRNSAPSSPIQFNAVVVKRAGKPRIWFMLDHRGGHVRSFEAPQPQICE